MPVRVEAADRVLTLTIDREERRNALNPEVLTGLRDGFRSVVGDASIGAIVLTGAGDKAFCAGADLGGMTPDGKLDAHFARGAIVEVIDAMQRCGKPVVARVNGAALAGGFGLLCGCDLAVSTDDATFGLPEIRSGLWPFIVSAAVRSRLPESIALELMMTGRKASAAEMERWGLLNRVVPRDQLDAATNELCAQLTDKSAMTMRLGKDSWVTTRSMERRAAMEHLHAMLGLCLETEDVVEGVTAFFQKRAPEWKHR